MGENNKKKQR